MAAHPLTLPIYRLLGQVLLVMSFVTAVFGFRAFQLGYWNDEPIALGMFLTGGLLALWLAVGMVSGWIRVHLPGRQPLVWIWIAWLVWQSICAALAPNPWRAWFGPPEQSEGVAWYICASVIMLALAQLWDNRKFAATLLGIMLALILTLAVLHFVSDELNNMFGGFVFSWIEAKTFSRFLPFVWPDYLGFMAGWWWIALQLTFPRTRLRLLIPVAVALLFVCIASSNHGAIALLSYAMLITLFVRFFQQRSRLFSTVGHAWRRLAAVALLLPLLWVGASPFLPTNYSANNSQSLPTRILINHIGLTALADHPSRLFFGRGWGQFADDFFAYGLVRDVRIYTNGEHRPNWPMIRGYNYHSHNMAMEALLSLGILGLLLWLAMPLVAVRSLRAEYFWLACPMLVAMIYLNYLWFSMPQAMPLQALGWFLFMRRAQDIQPGRIAPAYPCALLLLALCAALAATAHGHHKAMLYSRSLTDPFGQRYGTTMTPDLMREDIGRGGDRLRTFFIATTKRMAKNEEAIGQKHVDLYAMYLDSMAALSQDPRTGAYNGAAVLYGYNVLISTFRSPLLKPLRQQSIRNYFDIAKLHTIRAPYREDSIAPYLYALYHSKQDGEHAQLMAHVETLLQLNPSHRSALWLGGKVLAQQPAFATEGDEMMRAALLLGADRVYLIKKAEIP